MNQKSMKFNLIANGVKTLMGILFPLITFPYVSRVLGSEGIGKVNYANSIVAYFVLISALGINIYAVREGSRIRDDKTKFNRFCKEILRINLVTTAGAYILFFAFLCLSVLENYKGLLVIFSTSMLFSTIGMEWLFIIKEDYAYITLRSIAFQIISLIMLFLLVHNKDDYYWYAILTVMASVGSGILNFLYSRKIIDWKDRQKYEYRKHLKPIILIFGTSIASNIYMNMDTTMLGAFEGDSAVGIYTASVKINTIVSTLIGTISTTILPRVSYYIGNGLDKEYKRLMKTSMDILLMIAIPAAIGMICTSDILIYLFSGAEFLGGVTAARLLSVKVVIGAVNRVLAYQVCTPHKLDREVLFSTGAGAVFNLFANAVLIPKYGVTGAAIATVFSETVVFVILMYYSGKLLEVKRLYHRGGIYLLLCVPFWGIRGIGDVLFQREVLILAFTVLLCICLYGILLLVIKDPYFYEYKDKILKRMKL